MANVTQGSLNNFISETYDHIRILFKEEIIFDEEVDSWPFMSTPWPVILTLSIYLLFVLKVGPAIMENRKPLNVKYVILLYNAGQSLYNAWLISLLFTTPGALSQYFINFCYTYSENPNLYLLFELYKASWYFFLSKVIDLLDTVFFVLRKKQSQVTFLHVYHHINMVITTWAYLRFIKREKLMFCALINCFVHVIMYSYYFLSALGPQMQKYLWWKKYLTRLQIFQFMVIIGYNISMYYFNCNIPKLFMFYVILDTVLFLYLFCLFYKRTYEKNVKKTT